MTESETALEWDRSRIITENFLKSIVSFWIQWKDKNISSARSKKDFVLLQGMGIQASDSRLFHVKTAESISMVL